MGIRAWVAVQVVLNLVAAALVGEHASVPYPLIPGEGLMRVLMDPAFGLPRLGFLFGNVLFISPVGLLAFVWRRREQAKNI